MTLDHERGIRQITADDLPRSGLAGAPDLAIHHEPGLFLGMLDRIEGPLPIGVGQDVEGNPYLLPYTHVRDEPFEGCSTRRPCWPSPTRTRPSRSTGPPDWSSTPPSRAVPRPCGCSTCRPDVASAAGYEAMPPPL